MRGRMAIDKIEYKKGQHKILDEPKNARKAVKLLSQGKTQTSIADEFGVHRATVSRWVNREEIRDWIDQQAEKYIESLPNALALSKDVIDISRKQTDKAILRGDNGDIVSVNTDFIDQKILDAALREVDHLRKAVGITPSHTSSVVIGNLVLGNQQNVLMPNVQGILDRQLGEIMDVECEDITNSAKTELTEES